MQGNSAFWLWIPAALAVALAGCGTKQETTAKAASRPAAPVAVRTAVAEQRTVERSIMVTGSLAADDTTTVSCEVPGRVAKLHFDFGQAVRKGQVMAELDRQELTLQLERARASLEQAMARVGMDRETMKEPDTTPLIRQARAQMEDALSKYENAKRLVKTGDIAQERFTEIEKMYLARKAAYEAALDDLRTQLALIRALRAEVALAEKRLRDATVIAPMDGIVQARHVAEGQYVRDNAPIYTLVKGWPLRLRVEIPESAVAHARVGATLVFTTSAAPGAEFRARISTLDPALDPRARTLKAEAKIETRDERLKPGSFVQVRLVTDPAYPVVSIPRAAVYTVAGLNKFFTIENGKAVEHRIPEILGGNGYVEIPPGIIQPGAVVAVSNVPMLTDGAAVTIRK
ncbi:MAG: efflux RND transporter periplasmic adaptor subunit [Bryobacteraceae bacterium]|nr:efflux RND transporter periplasmic adaptor subunit [Bryobacteraceae bacterium]